MHSKSSILRLNAPANPTYLKEIQGPDKENNEREDQKHRAKPDRRLVEPQPGKKAIEVLSVDYDTKGNSPSTVQNTSGCKGF